uniref:Uncharacterized protein n=1 Tax=uncultured Chloroflexota bacterium TaxID=166587 RepID=H5SCW5_9CHLR|nr:hypothetical protein HGMM_F11H08C11 [uncultured Chloroflexota bacterium]
MPGMRIFLRSTLSLLVALVFSVTLATQVFYSPNYTSIDWLSLLLTPTVAFTFLIYLILPTLQREWRESGAAGRITVMVLALLAGWIWAVSAAHLEARGMIFFSVVALAAGLILPTAPSIQRLIQTGDAKRGALSALLGMGLAYLLVGFLENFYPTWLQVSTIAFVLTSFFSILCFYTLKQVRLFSKNGFLIAALSILLLLFTVNIVVLCLRFPDLLDVEQVMLSSAYIPYVTAAALAGAAWSVRLREEFEQRGWIARLGETKPATWARHRLPGLFLAGTMFLIYVLLGLTFNQVHYNTNNVFFAADTNSWRLRLGTPEGYLVGMRAVHPLAFLLLRPIVWALTLLTNGDWYYAAVLATALAGSISVYLSWHIIEAWTGRRKMAMIFASIMGVSSTYLTFGSLIESYIFSSLGLLLFSALLQRYPDSLRKLVPTGILTFGITVTNFGQSVLLLGFYNPKWKLILRYVALVLSISVFLSILNSVFFPASHLFFSPSDVAVERENTLSIFRMKPWQVWQRSYLVAREMALYSVVPPMPYQIWVEKEGRGVFPKFNFFTFKKGAILHGDYRGMGTLVVLMWVVLLFSALVLFLSNFFRKRERWSKSKFSLGLLACLAYNFVLHLNYGYEPFLYAADWTYALLLFVALSLEDLADRRWFYGFLLAFLILLMINNTEFVLMLMKGFQPFISP